MVNNEYTESTTTKIARMMRNVISAVFALPISFLTFTLIFIIKFIAALILSTLAILPLLLRIDSPAESVYAKYEREQNELRYGTYSWSAGIGEIETDADRISYFFKTPLLGFSVAALTASATAYSVGTTIFSGIANTLSFIAQSISRPFSTSSAPSSRVDVEIVDQVDSPRYSDSMPSSTSAPLTPPTPTTTPSDKPVHEVVKNTRKKLTPSKDDTTQKERASAEKIRQKALFNRDSDKNRRL